MASLEFQATILTGTGLMFSMVSYLVLSLTNVKIKFVRDPNIFN